MNKLIVTGRLTDDPKTTKVNDTTVTRFSVAVRRDYKNKAGSYDSDFISCEAWGAKGETIAKFFKKGDPIELEGAWMTDNYEKDGVKHYSAKCRVAAFCFPIVSRKVVTDTSSNPYTYGEPPASSSPFVAF